MNLKLIRQLLMVSKHLFYAFFLQVLLSSMLLANTSLSQNSINDIYVSIEAQNMSLENVFKKLERQTGFNFSYNLRRLDVKQRVRLKYPNASLAAVLTDISGQAKLHFKRINGNIFVKKQVKTTVEQPLEEVLTPAQVKISGKVTASEDGEPLPGVSILIKGTSSGTTTDIDGNYSLEAPEGSILQFSYIGFITQEVTITNQTTLNITMQPDLEQLEEVVVVGYGTLEKKDVTGALASVKGKTLTEVPTAGLDQALQGRVAGVNITKDSGAPGGGVSVQIRGINSISGTNAPLYVIDGFPVVFNQGSDVGGLAQINPGDIESIDILKDASATAIYGTRGANGVVLITTKQGKAGKSELEFSTFHGVNTVEQLDVLNTEQFANIVNDVSVNAGGSPVYSNIAGLPDVDYQDEVLRSGIIQNYQLSYTHGNDKTQYALIGSYYDEEGVVKGSDFQRYSMRFNARHKASERLKIGNNMTVSFTDYNIINSTSRGGNDGAVLQSALNRPPNAPIFDEDGNYIYAFENFIGDNPVSLVNEPTNERLAYTFLGNVFMDYEIIDNLTFRISVGGSFDNIKNNSFFPSTTFIGQNRGGSRAVVNSSNNYNWLNENTLNYKLNINDNHRLDFLAGYTLQKNTNEFVEASGDAFVSESLLFNNIGGATQNLLARTSKSEWGLASWLFRTNYSLKDKYLFTFSLRTDGSSRFGENERWGVFPSGAFAWRMSEEGFIKNIDAISEMKLRVGYGVTGNQPGPLFGFVTLLSPTSTPAYVFNGQPAVGVQPGRLGNPNLAWEETVSLNFGFDAGLFDNRLNLVLDVYRKTTDNLLFFNPLPSESGFTNIIENLGEMENNGIELSIDGVILDGPLKWNAGFNVSRNRNTINQLPEGRDILRGRGPSVSAIDQFNLIREGEPITTFFGYQIDGVYQTEADAMASGIAGVQAGDLIRRDVNGDGVINDEDRIIIGDAQANFTLGFNTSLNYKGFDFSMLWNGVFGNDILNLNRYELLSSDGGNNMLSEVLGYWREGQPSNSIPRLGSNIRNQSTSFALEDGSFLRLRNITLGYTVPNSTLDNLFGGAISNLRVYFTGQNLITITDYTGFDPEVNGFANNGGPNAGIQGLDYGTFPRPRTFIGGISVKF